METIVDNTCMDVAPNDGDDNDNDNDNDDGGDDDDDSTVDDDSTGDATCGECLAYITARLWKMAVPAASLKLDITTSAFSAVHLDLALNLDLSNLLWLQHRIRMFYYSMMSLTQKRTPRRQRKITVRTPRIKELLHTFTAEIFWSGAPVMIVSKDKKLGNIWHHVCSHRIWIVVKMLHVLRVTIMRYGKIWIALIRTYHHMHVTIQKVFIPTPLIMKRMLIMQMFLLDLLQT